MALSHQRPGTKERAAERRLKALEMRKAGHTYRLIGRALGVSDIQAIRDVRAALAKIEERETEAACELRRLELERLDMLLAAISTQVKAGHLGAIDRALRISESRRKLLGVDAPDKHEHALSGKDGAPPVFTIQIDRAAHPDSGAAAPDDD